ncbi:MAG: hypothetical protein GXY86_10295 [Firmicutes bacterium]|nr:hypothetical protein [Bacillota bacterium]
MRFKAIMLLPVLLLFCSFVMAEGEIEDLLILENQYIKIFINAGPEETGRFAVDVAAGDPLRNDDDGKPLIYGHPKPWTSYTTIRINGKNYVFGRATKKRAGTGLPGGKMITGPVLEKDQLLTQCRYDQVLAEQLLTIARSPSTGVLDTARIIYRFVNQGPKPVEIGVRSLIDTMLGTNDGAPFRVGETEITSDLSLNKDQYPDFWQAFDSLANPSVIAQGSLKGDGITQPDRIIFTNWGKPASKPWDFSLEPGLDFTRLGEDELDSAVVMYWDPRTVGPGEQFEVVIYYGLGGISFAPGNTFLGISAPAEVQYNIGVPRKYSVILYLEHRGEAKAKNIKVRLLLPKGLETAQGSVPEITLSQLSPVITKQFVWDVIPNGAFQGNTSFEIKVTGDGLESNQVKRALKIIGPPLLEVITVPPELKIVNNRLEPNPFTLTVKIKNIGQSTAYGLKAFINPESGIKLAPGERSEKYLTELAPNGETNVSWQVESLPGAVKGEFKITILGNNIKQLVYPGELSIPIPGVKVWFSDPGTLHPSQVFNCNLYASNLMKAKKYTLDVKYNPKQLRLVYVSRGTFLVEDGELAYWSNGQIEHGSGQVKLIYGIRETPFSGEETSLARLNFVVVGDGLGTIEVGNLAIIDAEERQIPVELSNLKYKIEGDGQ